MSARPGPPPRPRLRTVPAAEPDPGTLRTDWTDFGSPRPGLAPLLDDVAAFGARFIAWPTQHACTAWACWVAHCHVTKLLDSTPRLAVISPEKQSGKTRVLEVTESLVPSPLRTANTTTPVLFRLINSPHCPTVMLDEADAVWSVKGANEDLRALINAGHRRGSKVHRMTGEGARMSATAFDTFAPVALAGIGDLPDTVMDRSVVLRMRRRGPGEVVERWSFRRGNAAGEVLRDRLARWASGLDELDLPEDDDSLSDRAFDVWEPLLAIADLAGGPWPVAIRDACRVLTSAAPDEASLRVRLLAELRDVWPSGIGFARSSDLLTLLHELEDAPWGPGGLYGERGLTAHALARILGQYGIRSKHSPDKAHRGYLLADLEDPWARYLPRPRSESPSQPSEASAGGLVCLGCGEPMVADLCGDGRHPTCGEVS